MLYWLRIIFQVDNHIRPHALTTHSIGDRKIIVLISFQAISSFLNQHSNSNLQQNLVKVSK